jgi:hypothetical protein
VNFNEIASKKVAGIPVLYLAGGFVVILAVVAYRMKTTSGVAEPDTSNAEDAGAVAGESDAAADYSGLATAGTVTVVQSAQNDIQKEVYTNSDWEQDAIAYLVSEKSVSGVDAQVAVNKYLDGSDLTYEQKQWIDACIAKLKAPPDSVGAIGTIGTQPGQKQFSNFPGKHTVKNQNDNTPSKLAGLYYGSGSVDKARLIAGANSALGAPGVTYAPGTVVTIPAYHDPVWYKVTGRGDTTAKGVASRNGIMETTVRVLNTGHSEPYAKGSSVRIG